MAMRAQGLLRVLVVLLNIGLVSTINLDATSEALSQHLVSDAKGLVSCVVAAAPLPARPGDRIAFDIRVPTPPDSTLLGRLPASKRDYSSLPIRVFLIAAPARGERLSGNVAPVQPIASDMTVRRLGLTNDAVTDSFVRVEFLRSQIRAGIDVVAEKTAVTDTGEKITAQTRCRLTAAALAVWQ